MKKTLFQTVFSCVTLTFFIFTPSLVMAEGAAAAASADAAPASGGASAATLALPEVPKLYQWESQYAGNKTVLIYLKEYGKRISNCYEKYNEAVVYAQAQLLSTEASYISEKEKTGILSGVKASKGCSDAHSKIMSALKEKKMQCHTSMRYPSDKLICEGMDPEKLPKPAPNDPGEERDWDKARKYFAELRSHCEKHYIEIAGHFGSNQIASYQVGSSCAETWNTLKTGAAIGAVAGGGLLLYKNHEDKKEKKEKAAQAAAAEAAAKKKAEDEFQNGIASDGTNCKSPDTYKKDICEPVLLNYCGKSENSKGPGCMAFSSHYCAAADAAQGFCLAVTSEGYCSQSGEMIDQSPACEWVNSRPSSCARSPEGIECLTKLTPAQLDEKCPQFPNDPLCQAHMAGRVVVQPPESTSAESASNADAALASSRGGELNKLVESTTPGLSSTDQSSLAADGSSSEGNVWRSNSAAYAALCKRGQLVNCQ